MIAAARVRLDLSSLREAMRRLVLARLAERLEGREAAASLREGEEGSGKANANLINPEWRE